MTATIEDLINLANQGNAQAQKELGDRYLEDKDIERNEEEAFRWYRTAARQGLASAQTALGDCYMDGWGVEENAALALKW
jgi:TPR repeat protein